MLPWGAGGVLAGVGCDLVGDVELVGDVCCGDGPDGEAAGDELGELVRWDEPAGHDPVDGGFFFGDEVLGGAVGDAASFVVDEFVGERCVAFAAGEGGVEDDDGAAVRAALVEAAAEVPGRRMEAEPEVFAVS